MDFHTSASFSQGKAKTRLAWLACKWQNHKLSKRCTAKRVGQVVLLLLAECFHDVNIFHQTTPVTRLGMHAPAFIPDNKVIFRDLGNIAYYIHWHDQQQ